MTSDREILNKIVAGMNISHEEMIAIAVSFAIKEFKDPEEVIQYFAHIRDSLLIKDSKNVFRLK